MKTENLAVYPGSYDPLTNGHLDIIRRGLELFDRIVVVLLINPQKKYLFTTPERMDMLGAVFAAEPRIEIDHYQGLLVDYLRRRRIMTVVRGLRAISDFEIEFQMALMNRNIEPAMETVFLVPSIKYSFLSSRLVKEIYQLGGDVRSLVPQEVHNRLEQKFRTEEVIS